MAILAWNDPVKGSTSHYDEPSYWAPIVHTTTDGTWINDIVSAINSHLTGWTDRVDNFVVANVTTWTNSKWKSIFQNHIGLWQTPILLHPYLPEMSYWPSGHSAGGHFDVGRSYNFTTSSASGWTVGLYEPAGASLNIPKVVTATFNSMKTANIDNQGTIGY